MNRKVVILSLGVGLLGAAGGGWFLWKSSAPTPLPQATSPDAASGDPGKRQSGGRPPAPEQDGAARPADALAGGVEYPNLPITYGLSKDVGGGGRVGFFDQPRGQFYAWKGIRIARAEILRDMRTSPSGLEPLPLEAVTVVEVDPPVYYYPAPGGRYAVGYFDRWPRRFFRWQGVSVGPDDLPPAAGKNRLLSESSVGTVMDIEPPPHRSVGKKT